MHATFLGTNGWYASKTGGTVCTLIESRNKNIVLDAGGGIAKLEKFANLEKPTFVFLSHLHLDHVEGLHVISKFRFRKPLRIFCPKPYVGKLGNLLNRPYTLAPHEFAFPAKIIGMPQGSAQIGGFRATCKKLEHSDPCFGYRLEIEGKTIAYCPDTGICKNVYELAENADLLICEAAYLPGEAHAGWPHLNPESAAEIAAKSGAKKLVITHFDASRYTSLKQRKSAQTVARKIFPKTLSAFDGMGIEI
ncbi:MAG: ribonuclease Z [Candidatus Micrarchaeia archaeon]|jgi:ribonuclease BN (tRNA processing enzyme)